MMHPYLILVIASFTVFSAVLGFYWLRQFLADSRPSAQPQADKARRIQAIKASPSRGFSKT